MKNRILVIICCFFLFACSRGYYVGSRLGQAQLQPNKITLDSTYHFYVRQLYSEETDSGFRQKGNLSPDLGNKRKLIELEYILVSAEHKNAIYISTMPDWKKEYYNTYYLGEKYINIYDLKKISFGKINSEGDIEFEAKDGRSKDIWNLQYKNKGKDNFLLINTISEEIDSTFEDMIPVSKALQEELNFKFVEEYTIVFRKKYGNNTWELQPSVIYISYADKKYEVCFVFDGVINAQKGNSQSVFFDDDRVPYKPGLLYDR